MLWLFVVMSLLKKLKSQSRDALEDRRPALIQALKDLGDFYLELRWDFQSWGKMSHTLLTCNRCLSLIIITLIEFAEGRFVRYM